MIWQYWPTSAIQRELGDDLLGKIRNLLPLIDPDGRAVFFETNKKSLVTLLAAFAPEDYFRKKSNVVRCLDYLPQEKFAALCRTLGIDVKSQSPSELDNLAAKICKPGQQSELFLEFFSLSDRFKRRPIETPPSSYFIEPATPAKPRQIYKPYKVLKDYQCRVFLEALETLKVPMARLLLQMPTGSGKTRTAMELIAESINSTKSMAPRIVWLANSRELCEQAISCFDEIWRHVGTRPVKVQRYWSEHADSADGSTEECATFTVCSFQTAWKRISSVGDAQYFDNTELLIVDEAHISVAPTYSHVIHEIVRFSNCKVLGLTATPGRSAEDETTALSDLFHGNIASLKDPSGKFENVIAFLRSKRILSNAHHELLEISESVLLSAKEAAKAEQAEEFSDVLLKKIGADEIRNASVIARVRPYFEQGEKGLIFAPSVEASKFITSMLLFLDIKAAHIDGSLSSSTRDEIIEDFRVGRLDVLCNFGVLTAGFDAPKTDLVCIARPTKSPVMYSQMLGRGLRGPEVGGTTDCRIVEVRDSYLGMGLQDDLYRHFDEYWSSV